MDLKDILYFLSLCKIRLLNFSDSQMDFVMWCYCLEFELLESDNPPHFD